VVQDVPLERLAKSTGYKGGNYVKEVKEVKENAADLA